MQTSNAPATPTGEDAPAIGTQPALRQDEGKTGETDDLLQAVLDSDNLGSVRGSGSRPTRERRALTA